jgi:hypothetical protein
MMNAAAGKIEGLAVSAVSGAVAGAPKAMMDIPSTPLSTWNRPAGRQGISVTE